MGNNKFVNVDLSISFRISNHIQQPIVKGVEQSFNGVSDHERDRMSDGHYNYYRYSSRHYRKFLNMIVLRNTTTREAVNVRR